MQESDTFIGYDDRYGGEYDEPSYEAYDNSYSTQTQNLPEYYDYGHGTSEDAYDSYAQEEWTISRPSLKAPTPRSTRGSYREHPYATRQGSEHTGLQVRRLLHKAQVKPSQVGKGYYDFQ
ncbi:KH domain-containing RNA-binding signal transduction-associated protein 2 [Crotalus adamanteus]|uniref:KH domain-containing RNA-binding signal transduction-associated protein 2 n=1 Tax=Crotalus adamanteus TaxID=8729 RepID=A0AAW1C9Z2_CROAD